MFDRRPLPLSPQDKKGWPWTTQATVAPRATPSGAPWPRISLVTPSYNQAEYIEETIRSVVLQNYPNLEYIIIDGASKDDTVAIIKKYEPWLTYWESVPDKGQSHAINKGFARCTGDIYNWLCSDDILLPGALFKIALEMDTSLPAWIVGGAYVRVQDKGTNWKRPLPQVFNLSTFLLWHTKFINQPSVFWNKLIFDKVEGVREDLHFCMDTDLWYQFYRHAAPKLCESYFSQYRLHKDAKTTDERLRHRCNDELAEWILTMLCAARGTNDQRELVEALVEMQAQVMAFDRIRKHIVLGRLLSLWKLMVNRDIPV